MRLAIWIDPQLKSDAEALAGRLSRVRRKRVSVAEVMREALRRYLRGNGETERRGRRAPWMAALGALKQDKDFFRRVAEARKGLDRWR